MLEYLGHQSPSQARFVLLEVDHAGEIAKCDIQGLGLFVCLLAWDTGVDQDAEITWLARHLRGAGCAYICCWGRGAGNVEDLFDLVDIERNPEADADEILMSTCHEREPLNDALWFAMFAAYPSRQQGDTRTVLALTIGSPDYAHLIRMSMSKPDEFNSRMCAQVLDSD